MTKHKYETHVHTSESSLCGRSSGAEFARLFHALGYSGFFVTDHFMNGNTTASEDLPWAQRVQRFCKGFDIAAEEGARLGIDVFLAWEYSFDWSHFLTYGLGKDWLMDNPDVLSWEFPRYLARVRADGGCLVHAHPFREGVEVVHLAPWGVDAVEVLNAERRDESNRHALDFAASFGLPRTAGSDIHTVNQKRLAGVAITEPIRGGRDYLEALVSGDAVIFDSPRT